MKTTGTLATATLIAGYLTHPHNLLGNIGLFLAGLALVGIFTVKTVSLYTSRKEQQ